jgi:virginiamycin B lyase
LFCCLLLVGGMFAGTRLVLAADGGMHDHGHAPAQPRVDGSFTEIALPPEMGSPQSIALDPGGRIWLTEKVGKKLAAYDPDKKAFAIHTLPASWGNVGFSNITASADGAIWFTVIRWAEGAEEPYLLGRFTPADGYFTKLALPNKAIPEELAMDDGGRIWFLASNKNSLYRMDARTFALKGYPIPTANGHPRSLAVAPDGHIWFVETGANKLAEFDPGKEAFREYEVLTSFANLGKISIGKDGRVWFVEMTANKVGAFTPGQNRFDEFNIPTPNSSPVALAGDDRGNIWFLEYKGNKVGAFDPGTAVLREFDIPTYNSLPTDMAMDRKRSLIWFTQSATEAKKLGMLSMREALAAREHAQRGVAAEKRAPGGADGFPAGLAAVAGLAALGLWVIRRSRKGKHS